MDLKLLLADRKLGPASKLAYITMWNLAGRSPGRIVITAEWLGATCGRSPSPRGAGSRSSASTI